MPLLCRHLIHMDMFFCLLSRRLLLSFQSFLPLLSPFFLPICTRHRIMSDIPLFALFFVLPPM